MNGYVLENKLGISNSNELMIEEEKITKGKVIQLWHENVLLNKKFEIDSFEMYRYIHNYLFVDIYEFAGKIRDVNIAKGNFTFVPVRYIEQSIKWIDNLPSSTLDEIIDKYTEFNVLHPFREGNGRSLRIWLDNLLRTKFDKIVDWHNIAKNIYFQAMISSTIDNSMLKEIIKNNLIDYNVDNISFFKGLDKSYEYEEMNNVSVVEMYKEYLIKLNEKK